MTIDEAIKLIYIDKGKEIEKQELTIKNILNMNKKDFSIEVIADAFEIDIEYVEKVINEHNL